MLEIQAETKILDIKVYINDVPQVEVIPTEITEMIATALEDRLNDYVITQKNK